MGSPYVVVLDGYTFPRPDIPFRGPIVEFSTQRWVKQRVIGSVDPGSIYTLIGEESQEWEDLVSRAAEATKDKLVAVYATKAAVTLKTPQNPTTGFSVLMTKLKIRWQDPLPASRYLCTFTLVAR